MYGTIRQQQFQGPAMLSSSPIVSASASGLQVGQMQQINTITQPPPPQPVPAPQALQTFVEKMPIGLDHAPPAFNLREQVLGSGGANLQYIHKETGVQITLRGIGSLYLEANTNSELQEPMHLLIEHQRYENLNSAKQLAKNLIETLHQEFLQFQQATGTQVASPAQVPPPQLNVPPPNVIANVPPPAMAAPMVPQQQLSVMQQQLIPQMQIAHNGMIIQQQTPNLSMPPPSTQNAMMSMKPSNQIQLQFHQPPPTLSTQQTPFILNTQPQSIQYQYIQQTTTRDMQGNQQVTLQPIIQQSHLPIQSQQQYITVQQGNTAYMVPQSTIIHQTPLNTQPTQLSIIHQQAPPSQPAPQLQMQLPIVNVQPSPQNTAGSNAVRNEKKTDLRNDSQTSSSGRGEHDTADNLTSQEDTGSEFQSEKRTQNMSQQSMRQLPPGMPITSVPPPPLNMSVPPPVQHFVGNTLVAGNSNAPNSVLPQQQIIQATTNGQSYMGNNGNNWTPARGPPPPLGQPITEQTQQVALTFTQPPLQQTSGQIGQQFIQLQQQPQQQQFSIIQTTPLNSGNALQQQQQHQLLQFHQLQSNTLQMQQQQVQFSQQTQLMQKQQIPYQQQIRQQTQMLSDSAKSSTSHTRPAQKRRSTSEPDNSPAEGPPPQQQIRTGMGPQSNLTNVSITSASTPANNLGNSSNAPESGGVSGQDNSPAKSNSFNNPKLPHTLQQSQQPQQLMKPTHIGVMRYNQDSQRSAYDSQNHPPRGRAGNYNARPQAQQSQQIVNSNYGQRMSFIHSQPPPPLPQTTVYGVGANTKHINNNNYGQRRMPRP